MHHQQRILLPTPIRPCNIVSASKLENATFLGSYDHERRAKLVSSPVPFHPHQPTNEVLNIHPQTNYGMNTFSSIEHPDQMEEKQMARKFPYPKYATNNVLAAATPFRYDSSNIPYFSINEPISMEFPNRATSGAIPQQSLEYYPWNYAQPDGFWYRDSPHCVSPQIVQGNAIPIGVPLGAIEHSILRTPPSVATSLTPTSRTRNLFRALSPSSFGSGNKLSNTSSTLNGNKPRSLILENPLANASLNSYSSFDKTGLPRLGDESFPYHFHTPGSTPRSLPALVTPSPTSQTCTWKMKNDQNKRFAFEKSSYLTSSSSSSSLSASDQGRDQMTPIQMNVQENKTEKDSAVLRNADRKENHTRNENQDSSNQAKLSPNLEESESSCSRKYAMSEIASTRSKFPQYKFEHTTEYQYTVTARQARKLSTSDRKRQINVAVRVMVGEKPGDVYVVAKDVCALLGKRVGSVGRATSGFTSEEKNRMSVALDPIKKIKNAGDLVNQRVNVQVMSVLSLKGLEKLVRRCRSTYSKQVGKWALDQLRHFKRLDEENTRTHNLHGGFPMLVSSFPSSSNLVPKPPLKETDEVVHEKATSPRLKVEVAHFDKSTGRSKKRNSAPDIETFQSTSSSVAFSSSSSLSLTSLQYEVGNIAKRPKLDGVVRNLWPNPQKDSSTMSTSDDHEDVKGVASLLLLSEAASASHSK